MHTIRSRTVAIVSILLFSTAVLSQQKSIKFTNYTIEDGLSQSYVSDIQQDRFGYIWIATQDGINRFDGYHFDILKNVADNPHSLQNNRIHFVHPDAHYFWLGTNRGIGKLDTESDVITHIDRDEYPNLRGTVFTTMAVDENGHLWVVSEKNGLHLINTHDHEVTVIDQIHGNTDFSAIYSDAENTLWIGTSSGKIFCTSPPYDTFTAIPVDSFGSLGQINRFHEKSYQEMLIATETGPFVIKNKQSLSSLTKGARLRYTPVNCIYVEDDQKTWIGSAEKGLYLLSKENDGQEMLFHYAKNPYNHSSLVDDKVTTIFEDNTGVIWIGTEKGISKFDKYKQAFTTVSLNTDPDKGLVDYNVWSFGEDTAENIYIGTKRDLTVFHQQDQKFYHIYRDPTAYNYLISIYAETPEKIWLGFDDGLYLLSIRDLRFGDYSFEKIAFTDEEYTSSEKVYVVKPLGEDHLWIGSASGLSVLDKTNQTFQFYTYTGKPGHIGEGAVKTIFSDLEDNQWVVTKNTGLYRVIKEEGGLLSFEHHPVVNSSGHPTQITCVLQTESDYLWLGTYGEGLKRLHLTTADTESYTEADGLANNVVYGLLKDEDKNLWMSTNRGISKFNTTTSTFKNYYLGDGLQSNEFNTNAYMESTQGWLYFGGINGYNAFRPQETKINPNAPHAVISSVVVSSRGATEKEVVAKHIIRSKKLELTYKQNDITFGLASNSYSAPSKNRFKYLLKGYEEKFTYLENENKIGYLNIPPGSYELQVYVRSADGIWSKRPTTVQLTISPPFWLTWWFRIALAVTIIFIGLLIYRRRVDKIRRQKVRLEMEIGRRTRQTIEQSKKISEQKKRVEIQKSKIEHQHQLLEKEKEKVDRILLNMLPEGTAEELKSEGRSKARYYKNVSILFTDFVGFSKIAEEMNPQELVQKLDSYFTKFDEIIEKYSLEKIKTIGDAYMCAGGIPIRNKSNAIDVTLAALEIRQYMEQLSQTDPKTWKIRIGINTGEVTAGVIGLKRFAYDVWGAAVNQAQRMEMHGRPGTVNISDHTQAFIAPYFNCTFRGKIQTKHKGMLGMYSVDSIKPELSVDRLGTHPDKNFWEVVDLHLYSSIDYAGAERHMMRILETQLSSKLLYHSINHTIDVVKAVERIAIMEGVTDQRLFLLKAAATYHDAGFIETYDDNEEVGIRLTQEILPKYGYSKEQIDTIDELIKSTMIPQNPRTHLQQIICDADLDYLGRDDFHEIADLLRQELRTYGKLHSDRKWDEIQVDFLESHTYFTESAIQLRRAKKMFHLQEIKQKLETFDYKD